MTFMGGNYWTDRRNSAGDIIRVVTWEDDMCSNNEVVRSGGQIQKLLEAGYQVFHAMPMCLANEKGDNAKRIYTEMITGTVYRTRYQTMLNRIAAWYSPTDTGLVMRIGWETNKGYPWSWDGMDAEDAPFYRLWYREVYSMCRATLPSAKICWNFLKDNNNKVKYPRDYPGNDVIDIVGCDLYDNGFGGFLTSETRWQASKGQYITSGANAGNFFGPQGFTDFVLARRSDPDGGHIKLAFDEWGATPAIKSPDTPPWPADGAQNNTFFPPRMFQHFNQYADIMAGEHYYNGNIHHRIEPVQVWTTNSRAGYLTAWRPS
jgi:hypothetical protein